MNTNPTSTSAHPLDPLSLDEMQLACDVVKASQPLDAHGRFPVVELREPPKAEVLAFTPGAYFSRRAFVVAIDRTRGTTTEYVVDLREKQVEAVKPLALGEAPYGQPPVMIEDFMNAERIVKEDAGWRAAVKKRGLTDDDLERVQVDPFSAGAFDRPNENGRRLVRCVSYYRDALTDNGYAHPIEGVVAVVDLLEQKVIELIDDGRIIPIPRDKHNYDTPSLGKPRDTVKPLSIDQPEGPSFTVDGWQVSWQNWKFRVGFTPREGLVLHQLSWDDGKTARPVIYRASVTEMCVPYSDPTTNHYWKSAFDAGEYGLGKLANQLELGCDCLGTIRYFDIPAADDFGNSFAMKNAVCMHEEDYGTLWKHYEFRTGVFEVRRSRRLVISFFATVGNYDYGFYWYLYQDGTIQLECKLTGIIQTSAVASGDTYPWGGMVTEHLGGPTHQHFFNARLHMMVDGEKNAVTEHEFVPRPMGDTNPYGNVFDTTKRVLKTEGEAARNANGSTGRYWKIVNPNVTNPVGANPGYKLIVNDSPLMLADPASKVRQRGGFATRHLWVTPYDPAQRYASGDYPNQHAGGDGLPRYIEANRNVENEDIVVWHSFGHTHVCKPEDFPVMPVEYAGFMLKPNNFFYGNPAMDLPGGRDPHSVQDGAVSGHCCKK
ncbi:primary-amine oxidase [Paraburkholderia caballeronis]|uniref:Amine oxidase n=1 Tax=Paraburkholderia caballeronis TaxID=416943 RepID=A0A1H7U125_9BURK|nr:primary-amine oxidase [Paraburkholderia caballeronis]PXW23436.1 Cu2+-containing amine oxidase [Paraburkholderia caballeronis]PXW98429.1 Cu2+-containing amine oxidase [Paraburkholderia caballeronis]RAJ95160.1 Cu2+-containing amine oxidase [Paraburkholderia caballeronis]SEC53495.1 primary-amine oxidase [Paraburkholderia caballeronis]SEL90376.1 primary-amine oxidase [Paraburkholderia caballeronis]